MFLLFTMVNGYNKGTREKVVAFLREHRQSLVTEIHRLGGSVGVVNWASLMFVLADLELEGLVRSWSLGRKVVYEWIGP